MLGKIFRGYGWLVPIFGLMLVISMAAASTEVPPTYINIADITRVRLYDKLFMKEFLVEYPNDIIQLYTNFLYDYRTALFRYGFYDDVFGWAVDESTRLINYDYSWLSSNRFASKLLVIFTIEVLNPQPDGYFYRTYLLCGMEALTGVPFKLGIHDGEVWGSFLKNEYGMWGLYSGRDPFIDGLTFESRPVARGYRLIDLIYYTDGAVDSYTGPMALNERIRVFSLRCSALELTPPNPVVEYPPAPRF